MALGTIGVSPDTTIPAWQSAPAEIVREFFKYFSSPLHVRNNGHSINFPWYLGHICSAWRIEFLSMSTEFWSTFRLDFRSYDTSIDDVVAMAKVFLQCNRGQLFSFNILPGGAFHTDVLQVFIPESSRWLDVSISLRKRDISILSPVKDRLPHLRSLELNTDSHWQTSSQGFLGHWGCFEIAPNLTYVKSNAVRKWRFDWSNITTLVHTDFLEHAFHKIIPKLHNLEKLVIPGVLEETSNDYDNMSILTFPRLRVLRTLEPMILKVLQTPTLEQLYIDDSTSFLELEPVPPFLDRSKCALQNLYIGHLKLESSGAFPAILQRSPDIKSLTIRVSGHGRPCYQLHYELLTCRPNMPSLAPKLKALTIVFPDNSTNDIDGFTAMVASRTAERLSFVEQLQRVTVVLDSRKTIPDIFQQICEEHAVNFNFVYHDCWHIKGNDPIWDLEDDDIKWS